ncbi:unnamed protein product [Ilex paraguariensis]|uniref:Uncharacterized protein n=1 Tax=Ilex paraguariensis TaxID=185542 RepID=A0ABC8U622_9AQUA
MEKGLALEEDKEVGFTGFSLVAYICSDDASMVDDSVGEVYYYYPFSALSDPAKIYNDLRWNITRPQGLEAVMRVRCSQGLQVQEYYGNFCKRVPTDVDLPAKLQFSTECDSVSRKILISLNPYWILATFNSFMLP